jgi:hypothetical protein
MTDFCVYSTNRIALNLPTQQDKYTSCNGEDRQDHAEASNTQKLDYTPGYEKDGQQQKADILCEFHGGNPFFIVFMEK